MKPSFLLDFKYDPPLSPLKTEGRRRTPAASVDVGGGRLKITFTRDASAMLVACKLVLRMGSGVARLREQDTKDKTEHQKSPLLSPQRGLATVPLLELT